jgi:hypothetical protein
LNQIFQSAAEYIQLLCGATRINLDPPQFHDQYVSFPLNHWHQIEADFFIRSQSLGITIKGDDLNLFYVLQSAIACEDIELKVLHNYHQKKLRPIMSGDGQYDRRRNPCPSDLLATISSGNLRDISDIQISRSHDSFDERAKFLANLLFTQWIVKMMPLLEPYKDYKRLGLLVP